MAIRDLVPWRRSTTTLPVREIHPLSLLHEDVDRLFGDFFGDSGLWPTWPTQRQEGAFVPRVDIEETDKEIRVIADLPGLDEKDVHVDLTDDGLTIRGEKKSEHEGKREGYYHAERSYGSFERSIPLPGTVDADKVAAQFKNGVLTITLPRPPEATPTRKRIEIKKG